VAEGWDVVIRVARPDDATKGAKLLFETEALVCASATHYAPLSTPETLATACWIKTPMMDNTVTLHHRDGGSTERVQSLKSMEVNSGQLVRQLVDQGAGFALFPPFAVRHGLNTGQLINLLPDWHAGRRGFFTILTARNAHLSVGRAFVDGLATFLEARTTRSLN
jgi:DNA-binding transcriptional LysR family regulator